MPAGMPGFPVPIFIIGAPTGEPRDFPHCSQSSNSPNMGDINYTGINGREPRVLKEDRRSAQSENRHEIGRCNGYDEGNRLFSQPGGKDQETGCSDWVDAAFDGGECRRIMKHLLRDRGRRGAGKGFSRSSGTNEFSPPQRSRSRRIPSSRAGWTRAQTGRNCQCRAHPDRRGRLH
jgi:hypothetical protein